MGPEDVLARDRGLLWHPYAPLDSPPLYAVTAASGVWLDLVAQDGGAFHVRDAMSSWWAALYGYRQPALDKALYD